MLRIQTASTGRTCLTYHTSDIGFAGQIVEVVLPDIIQGLDIIRSHGFTSANPHRCIQLEVGGEKLAARQRTCGKAVDPEAGDRGDSDNFV